MAGTKSLLWGIVLAGGEGERLREFVQQHLGTDAPKQFCAFFGRRTMLEHALRRAEMFIPRDRLVVVATAHHSPYVFDSLGDRPPGTLLFQPIGRGTAPGILLPLVYILHKDPRAVVAILPSDQFILPGRRFMAAVAAAADHLTGASTDSLVMLAVKPTYPETDYGWIEPGSPFASTGLSSVRRINRFVEKPSREQAESLMAEGCLWNTMVIVARAQPIMQVVQEAAPELAAYFSMVQRAIGTVWEHEVLNEVYQFMPSVNFSTAVLTRRPERFLVLPVRKVLWSDWGRGDRILATLARLGVPLSSAFPVSARVRLVASSTAML